nr:follitropin subunit beta-like [Dasypus novemcinctus]
MKSVQFCFLFCCWKAICYNSCELTDITIVVESHFCISINISRYAGYCDTQDLVHKNPAKPKLQKAHTFNELVYETVRVPGCAHHTDSLYTYPVATESHSGKYDSDTLYCVRPGAQLLLLQ